MTRRRKLKLRHRFLRRWARALGGTAVDDAYLLDGEL